VVWVPSVPRVTDLMPLPVASVVSVVTGWVVSE
jgi:hypothetical protein